MDLCVGGRMALQPFAHGLSDLGLKRGRHAPDELAVSSECVHDLLRVSVQFLR